MAKAVKSESARRTRPNRIRMLKVLRSIAEVGLVGSAEELERLLVLQAMRALVNQGVFLKEGMKKQRHSDPTSAFAGHALGFDAQKRVERGASAQLHFMCSEKHNIT